MATTPPIIQTKITSDPVKVPMMPVLIAVVAGVVVATAVVGGVLFYLLRSGKVPIHATVAPTSLVPASSAKTHMVVLEPLLVNLMDASGSAYLRAGLTLQESDAVEANGKKAKAEEAKPVEREADAAVRDTILSVLSRETSEQLLAPDGKDRLKKELKEALAQHNPDTKVVDLFFTEFLVQR